MSHTINGYESRARECVRLAHQANDEMIKAELLKLRQTYLTIAQRLRDQDSETKPHEK